VTRLGDGAGLYMTRRSRGRVATGFAHGLTEGRGHDPQMDRLGPAGPRRERQRARGRGPTRSRGRPTDDPNSEALCMVRRSELDEPMMKPDLLMPNGKAFDSWREADYIDESMP